MKNKIKAIALLSGGLDSILAIRIILEQKIEVTGVYFTSPFWNNDEKEKRVKEIAKENKIELLIIPLDTDYIDIIKNPKHGHGKGINPCIDCKIYILKKAKEIMNKVGANFIITGEVIGQRPMSQRKNALCLIEKESGLKKKLLRPLSAKLLQETEAEQKGWVNREKLIDISGRTRKTQIELAKKFNINNYSSPAGGCLLTEKKFANKLVDLFNHNDKITFDDIILLKYGRHFRFNDSKIILGKNKEENKILIQRKNKNDYIFEIPNHGSPNTLLQEKNNKKAIIFASRLTALYSDCQDEKIHVKYGTNVLSESIVVKHLPKEEADKYNLAFRT